MTDTVARPPYDPELAAALQAIEAAAPPALTLDLIPAVREAGVAGIPPLDELFAGRDIAWHDVTIAGHNGDDILVSVYHRKGRDAPAAGIYHVHGGGMVMGDRSLGVSLFADQIERGDAVVVSVEYRLAPEHPDPYPVEDCYAGLVWTAEHATELGIDPARLMIAGGSAGGGLAAGVALLSRDRGGPALFAQLLMCPMLDDRDDTVSTRQIETGMWNRASNRTGWTALLGDRRGGDDVSIYAAPARATDLSGLPPAYIDCGSAEVFRDEDVAYAQRLWAAGVQAELHVWAGGFHGFEGLAPHAEVSRAAGAARRSWLNRTLGA
ncbi:alpha/beta hydrolase [Dactylosporangium sp. AC04546]|uniref:alpha/beta hydrolase n=1 Tax=Dactylosporangium sp. AC04546 TaxID=2862460 RepID=UPI001EDD2846|nr:alpha/beta hydrolase [Dactylosporangium sp. AC04546]WVK87367.1 alpha/beta hydrolase [Dactylosporangium sp. AC04546]